MQNDECKNAWPHVARICTQFLKAENIPVLAWSAYSPDMSPIQHVWDALDRRIRPANIQQFCTAIEEECHWLTTLCEGDVLHTAWGKWWSDTDWFSAYIIDWILADESVVYSKLSMKYFQVSCSMNDSALSVLQWCSKSLMQHRVISKQRTVSSLKHCVICYPQTRVNCKHFVLKKLLSRHVFLLHACTLFQCSFYFVMRSLQVESIVAFHLLTSDCQLLIMVSFKSQLSVELEQPRIWPVVLLSALHWQADQTASVYILLSGCSIIYCGQISCRGDQSFLLYSNLTVFMI